jgi:hypothetical protein
MWNIIIICIVLLWAQRAEVRALSIGFPNIRPILSLARPRTAVTAALCENNMCSRRITPSTRPTRPTRPTRSETALRALSATTPAALSAANLVSDAQLDHEIRSLALPALAGIVIDPLLSLIDTGYIAQLGGTALASLGPCTSLFHFAYAIPRALTLSTSTLVAAAVARESVDRPSTLVGVSGGGGSGGGNGTGSAEIARISMALALLLGVLTVTFLSTQG